LDQLESRLNFHQLIKSLKLMFFIDKKKSVYISHVNGESLIVVDFEINLPPTKKYQNSIVKNSIDCLKMCYKKRT
jgi:hypothetical protein